MNDEDLDALAAEYVLGTLSADERGHAESVLQADPGFAEMVRQWERRLGELNVMVEAVEPPAEVWDQISTQVAASVREAPIPAPADRGPPPLPDRGPPPLPDRGAPPLPDRGPPPLPDRGPPPLSDRGSPPPPDLVLPPLPDRAPPAVPKVEPLREAQGPAGKQTPPLAALAAALSASEEELREKKPTEPPPKPKAADSEAPALAPTLPTTPPKIERSADMLDPSGPLKRWRVLAVLCAALAAVLALFIAVAEFAPDLLPAGVFPVQQGAGPSPTPPTVPGGRFVAVLQSDPTAPAFLLTLDPTTWVLTVRTISAVAEAGHSYELWISTPQSSKLRSLGVIGSDKFAERPLPSDLSAEAMETARFEVSFERAGGSKTGSPTGPIIFRGNVIETRPARPRT